jgi:tripeptide aminopeptidase
LIARLPGTRRAPRRLFSAHLDTVPLCVGSRIRKRDDLWESAVTERGIGADDRAGVAVLLATVAQLVQQQLDHPPLTFLWTVQEEIGLQGARHVRPALLGPCRMGFNWDGGQANKVTIGATGAYRIRSLVHGLASHAGNAPQKGVSAITVASLAVARLEREGWLGAVHKGTSVGTSNVGRICGGSATNVVADRVELWAEARSHDPQFRRQIADAIHGALQVAATEVSSEDGRRASIEWDCQLDYESYCLDANAPVVQQACAAVAAEGGQPDLAVANGGLDANWLTAHGIPTVSLGCGQRHQHTPSEQLDLQQFDLACRIALRLATDSELSHAAG